LAKEKGIIPLTQRQGDNSHMIFIDLSISEKVETLAKMIAEILLSEQLAGAERRRLNEDSPYEALLGKGQVLLTELGNLIHSRLWTPQDVIPSDQSGPG
jgi:oligoribonuclease NrnB/cAMP/cGMP phosphodiesterase (DHH superfamily)